ncbi:hypothetical protein ACT4UT_19195, partial [Bacillus sp. B-TM1]
TAVTIEESDTYLVVNKRLKKTTAVVAVIASIVSGDKIFIIAMCLLAGMVIYKHRANIGRIINKTEPKANFSKKQK